MEKTAWRVEGTLIRVVEGELRLQLTERHCPCQQSCGENISSDLRSSSDSIDQPRREKRRMKICISRGHQHQMTTLPIKEDFPQNPRGAQSSIKGGA